MLIKEVFNFMHKSFMVPKQLLIRTTSFFTIICSVGFEGVILG